MTEFDLICSDFDGTLCDSELYWTESLNDMLVARGLPPLTTNRMPQELVGFSIPVYAATIKQYFGFTDSAEDIEKEAIDRFLARFRAGARLRPGVEPMLRRLQTTPMPHPPVICTSNYATIVEIAMDAIPLLRDVFGDRVFAPDVTLCAAKPDPALYTAACTAAGVHPSRAVAIEDSANGARAAVAAGMTCLVCPEEAEQRPTMREISPHVFDSMDDVHAWLLPRLNCEVKE